MVQNFMAEPFGFSTVNHRSGVRVIRMTDRQSAAHLEDRHILSRLQLLPQWQRLLQQRHVFRTFFIHGAKNAGFRSEEHTSELQSRFDLVCRLLLEKKKK